MTRIARWGLVLLLMFPVVLHARPQQQEESLAAAAKRAQEKKKEQTKPAKVWDNDNISAASGTVSVVGKASEAAQAAAPAAQAGAAKEVKPEQTAEQKSANAAEIAAAKQQMESLKTDLDIMQRKYILDQQMYYNKPDYQSDKAGAAALNDEQSQIDAKQQEITDLQKKIDDRQAKAAPTSK